MDEYTVRRNLNRGYMKLEVWNLAMDLFEYCFMLIANINIDLRLKSQILNAAQSISSNIAEGYCRRSANEYLQFLNYSLGSSGELFTRILGLKKVTLILQKDFEEFDQKHYKLENKLLALVKSVQYKRTNGSWDSIIHEPTEEYEEIESVDI